ncbi:MAG: hypothetical protein L7S63_09555 [Flavobacteriales bacterium]|nr:hypothetical protein [Flavobacteriales bacterium]
MREIFIYLLLFIAGSAACAQIAPVPPVTNASTGQTYETITAAINDASAGDFINLAATQFTEHIDIDLPLTVTGAMNGTSVIDVSQEDGWGITLSSDHITLQNVTVVGGDLNSSYAIHSVPGITGLTLDGIQVSESNRSCIDLNGLTGPDQNVVKNLTVKGSAIGFGLAMSACAHMLVENIVSMDNGFGDIAIMESNYSDQEITDVVISGSLELGGPEGLGGGGIVVQLELENNNVGIGGGFPISINSDGYEYSLEAPGGDLTGCIVVHSDDVRNIAGALGAQVEPLVSYDLVDQNMVVFPGMLVQSAISAAQEGAIIQLETGVYDSSVISLDKTVHLIGPNAEVSGTADSERQGEAVLPGFLVTGGQPSFTGVKIVSSGSDAIEVSPTAAGVLISNSVLLGDETVGTHGILARGVTALESVKVGGFNHGVDHRSGDLSMEATWLKDNATGLVVDLEDGASGSAVVTSCIFENVAGTGVRILGGQSTDALNIDNCTFNLHALAMDKQAPVDLTMSSNSFANSESHVAGFDREAQVSLCGSNSFVPALRISGCMDSNADNYLSCASIAGFCAFEGCTSPKACNFDVAANTDDGSCDFLTCAACPLEFACNYNPAADLYKVEACEFFDCEEEGMAISDEDRALLMVVDGCTIPQACNYDPVADNDDGSCAFDCYGCLDTEACNYEAGFTQAANVTCLYLADLHTSPHVDCDGHCNNDTNENGICDEEEVEGCMDPNSCNYSEEASLDDGSCDFTTCLGCTNPGGCNHDPSALISDASCDYDSCSGCTDNGACNYDPTALVDNASCVYPVDLYNKSYVDCNEVCLSDADGDGICDEEEESGCTDSGACNFDESATDEDGTCEYTSCAGCPDPSYCNYNPMSTIDDGSCASAEDVYPEAIIDGQITVDCLGRCINDANGDGICDEAENNCPGDFNQDGIRGAADILILLSAFGCEQECGAPDMNGDGLVAASDILSLLSAFGVACPD